MSDTQRQKALGDLQAWLAQAQAEALPLTPTLRRERNPATAPTVLPNDPATTPQVLGPETPPPPPLVPLHSQEELEKQQEDAEKRLDNKYTRALRQEKARLAEQERIRKEEEAKRTELQKATQSIGGVVASGLEIGKTNFSKGKSALEKVPIPGDIKVPLTILLLFFLVLFPVNGHTRLTWLWLTITNNARIGSATLPVPTLSAVVPPVQTTPSVQTQLTAFAGQSNPLSSVGSGPSNGHISGNYGQLLQNTHNI